ncbi:XdhC/CoxI family protein [Nocardia yunnanensis]|uniref:XdhC/CoxI family protein n=1 Tax=Nocardia yunnanensis TaxID=2382165 RepID=A0A386ZPG4_9NOCA|nr:XdhC/CoxI family protein [Nocardia yunnanensis]AYF78455.1 XdhC/CoxI family protein [Nocardia yunnanensis]
MRDIAEQMLEWMDAGEPFAVASVIGVRGSAPRGPGAALAVRADGTTLGSVSGGCLEGTLHDSALEVLRTGEPIQHTYDHDPDDPFAVGLTCGGVIEVHVQRCDPHRDAVLATALRAAGAGTSVAVARVLSTGAMIAVCPTHFEGSAGDFEGSTGDTVLDYRIAHAARAMLAQGKTGLREIRDPSGDRDHRIFIECWSAPPRMLVFGAIDYASALARIGKFLGYHVTVCDARAVFATPDRFPDADDVVVQWPHRYLAEHEIDERTVICVLTHDAKFDVPALELALRGRAGYVGALGSRRTHDDRMRRLRAAGLDEHELSRLHSPIGLDLGASTPEETAVSIAAEIIAARTRATTLPLADSEGPIRALV